MDELYREYLAYLRVERGSSPLTVSAYAADLKDYARFLEKRGIRSVDDVDREVIVAYESDLFDRAYAASTVDRHVSVLKGFHRFLVREGYARRNPADTIQLPKAPDRLPAIILLISGNSTGSGCRFSNRANGSMPILQALL